MSYQMRCGRCAAETPRFQSYQEVSRAAIRAGYMSSGVTYGYPGGNHAWFRSVVLCPACAKALSVNAVVKLLDDPAFCSASWRRERVANPRMAGGAEHSHYLGKLALRLS